MYGVPPDLALGRFIGRDLNQIALGRFQSQFDFAGAGSIFSESYWELRGPDGDIVDAACEHAERDCYRVHDIIDVPVLRFTIDAPISFTLVFESGHALTVFDDSNQYESFSVHLDGEGGIFV
jgi:hypothetical protein